ncbi:MAG: cytochrome c [Thermodesulfobacteriota bacterium]
MTPRLGLTLLAAAVTVLVATGLFAETVLVPGVSPGKEVVAVRKYVMVTNNANLRDIRLKLEANKSVEVVSNARSMAAVAMTLPYLFADAHPDAYPMPGSIYAYKAAPMADVQTGAELFNAQCQKLVNVAGNAADSAKQLERVKDACRDCHAKMRKESK